MGSTASTAHPQETVDSRLERRIDRMLQAAEARVDEPVCVAGPQALDVVCALSRRGFQRVELARGCTCGCADLICDVLLLPGGSQSGQIVAIAEAVSAMLRPGARVVISTHELGGSKERDRLANLLAHRGFRYRIEAHFEPVLVATKPGLND